jgi:hypothetical protein
VIRFVFVHFEVNYLSILIDNPKPKPKPPSFQKSQSMSCIGERKKNPYLEVLAN